MWSGMVEEGKKEAYMQEDCLIMNCSFWFDSYLICHCFFNEATTDQFIFPSKMYIWSVSQLCYGGKM